MPIKTNNQQNENKNKFGPGGAIGKICVNNMEV